jgi:hypothetical protein
VPVPAQPSGVGSAWAAPKALWAARPDPLNNSKPSAPCDIPTRLQSAYIVQVPSRHEDSDSLIPAAILILCEYR